MASNIIQSITDNPWLTLLTATVAFPLLRTWIDFFWTELRSSSLPRYRHGGDSTWALVTGASDGIGFGFASELAVQGFNVILHGRNPTKIENLIKGLNARYPERSFRMFIADAADRSAWHKIDELAQSIEQEDLKLTVLVNNVGGGPSTTGPVFVPFEKLQNAEVNETLDKNAAFPAQITRTLLPILKKRQPSLIMNIGSGAGTIGLPYIATYCGCKSFNSTWSRSLRREMIMDKDDVEVMLIHCGKVQSAGTKMTPTNVFVPSSAKFAKSSLQKVGCGHDVVSGYWGHALQTGMFNIIPSFLLDSIALVVTKNEIAMEKKAL